MSEVVIAQGRAAALLLADEDFQAVLADLRTRTVSAWRATTALERDKRERLFFEMHALDAIETAIRARADAGKLEAARAERRGGG
jgi:hypothetical protein